MNPFNNSLFFLDYSEYLLHEQWYMVHRIQEILCDYDYVHISQRGCQITWPWIYRWLWATKWVLGIKPVSSVRVTSMFNHWAIFSSPLIIFFGYSLIYIFIYVSLCVFLYLLIYVHFVAFVCMCICRLEGALEFLKVWI